MEFFKASNTPKGIKEQIQSNSPMRKPQNRAAESKEDVPSPITYAPRLKNRHIRPPLSQPIAPSSEEQIDENSDLTLRPHLHPK